MKKVSLFNKEQKGQSVIEFSMMLPIFLLIVMFSIEICFGTYYKMVLNHLLLDVARVVAVSDNETTSALNSKVQGILTSYQNKGSLLFQTKNTSLFTLTWTTQTVDVVYKVITVQASYTGIKLPFIGTLNVSDKLIFPYVDHGTGI